MTIIEGCLLEGVDYAGKTSIAKKLIEKLKKENVRVKYNKDYISDNYFSKKLISKGDKLIAPDISQDLFYIITKIIDINNYKINKKEFIIQDRYLLSTLNHFSFFYLNKNRDIFKIYDKGIHFKKNIYLTSTLSTKIERFKKNKPTDSFDIYLSNNLDMFQEYDNFCLSNVPKSEDWKIIQTDNLSIESLVNIIIHFIKN
ncbi:MAG: hypothetical protein PHN56_00405 [Candidatus Nanoarchaeia archaeon]|nr:hypothetical protein [Candidatus Nanoarchaeia archaeon]